MEPPAEAGNAGFAASRGSRATGRARPAAKGGSPLPARRHPFATSAAQTPFMNGGFPARWGTRSVAAAIGLAAVLAATGACGTDDSVERVPPGSSPRTLV